MSCDELKEFGPGTGGKHRRGIIINEKFSNFY